MDKRLAKLINLVALIAGVLIIYNIWILVFPPDIVTFENPQQKVLNENHQVKRLGILRVEVKFCKNLPYKATSTVTQLEDGVIWIIPSTLNPQEVGCRTVVSEVKIPKEIPLNETVRLRKKNFYQVSSLREPVVEEWVSEPFIVIE